MPHASLDAFRYDRLPQEHLHENVEAVVKKLGFQNPRYDVRPGSKAGDNYASLIYRVEVTDEEDGKRKLQVIVKCAVQNAAQREAIKLYRAFRNEANAYQLVLQAYSESLREKELLAEDASYPDAPRCYSALAGDGDNQDQDVLVLQDMRPEGFVMQDRKRGLDEHHVRVLLRALAHLHAASFAMEHLKPEEFERLRSSISELFEEDSIIAKMFSGEAMRTSTLAIFAKKFPPGSAQYEKLQDFLSIPLSDRIFKLIEPCPDGGNVLNHGDCWVNNVLFKYSESGAVESVCLLDFQIMRYASPALDLSYLLFMCTEKAMRDAHLDELLREYHEELHARMRLLGVPDPDAVFSWQQLQDHLKRYACFGFIFGLLGIPVFLAEQDEVPDLETRLESGVSMEDIFVVDIKNTTDRDRRISGIAEDVIRLGYV